MTSVVIAAHNEAAVIGRCLDALLVPGHRLDAGLPSALEVIVAANGCTDSTAEVARRRGVRVVEVDEASKAVALNRGDAAASTFPRIYLDADITVPAGGIAALERAVDGDNAPLAAVPRRRLELSGRPLAVRAYFAINARLPAFQDGLFGRGLIVLSDRGRARFEQFPLMVADDLFLDSLFDAEEKTTIETVEVAVAAPLRTRDLLRRLVRVRRGNAAMREAGRVGAVPVDVRPADRFAWLRSVVVPHPHLAPAALVYVVITALAAALARRSPASGDAWGRDDSTRQDPTKSERTYG